MLGTLLVFCLGLHSKISFSRRGIIQSSILAGTVPKNNDNTEESGLLRAVNNEIYYAGPITDQAIFALSSNILNLQSENNDFINLHMQSGGGSLLPTLGLVDLIRTSDIPINTFVNGYCASAASLITVVGTQRLINKYGVILIHQLKMGLEYGKYNEIKDQTENAETLMNIVKDIYLEHTNLDNDNLDSLLNHDYWLNSTTSKSYGLVDIII
tara:strand:- start:18094 stop:18729 length:636 start_codon:yes stop_codon:yes gene_type:complete